MSPPSIVVLRVRYRVVSVRILGDTGNTCTFGQGKLRHLFTEVPFGCSLYTQTVLSQIDGVHVAFQDLFLAHLLFDLESKELFLELSFQFIKKCFFLYEIGKYIILDQLLGQGTCTLLFPAKSRNGSTGDSLDVNTVVVVETFILGCHKCVRQMFRYIGESFVYSVGAGGNKTF